MLIAEDALTVIRVEEHIIQLHGRCNVDKRAVACSMEGTALSLATGLAALLITMATAALLSAIYFPFTLLILVDSVIAAANCITLHSTRCELNRPQHCLSLRPPLLCLMLKHAIHVGVAR